MAFAGRREQRVFGASPRKRGLWQIIRTICGRRIRRKNLQRLRCEHLSDHNCDRRRVRYTRNPTQRPGCGTNILQEKRLFRQGQRR